MDKTMHDAAIDALLDAINVGREDLAAEQARTIAHLTLPPRCPSCGSTEFLIAQFTWNRQGYDTETGDWGSTINGPDYEDHPYAAECAECETDCTDLLADANEVAFQEEPTWTDRARRERKPVSPFLAAEDVR